MHNLIVCTSLALLLSATSVLAAPASERGPSRFEERLAKLPPEKQQQVRECREVMQEVMPGRYGRKRGKKEAFETLPKPVQDEINGFTQARKDAYEKLSPAAKEALRTHRHPRAGGDKEPAPAKKS